jgi:1-acyl-sn-glycerol-3-phosphate acyltransferase
MGDLTGRTNELRETASARAEELRSTAAAKRADVRRQIGRLDVPWARCRTARMAREAILQFGLAPLMALYTRTRVAGRERFAQLPPPVILVANHGSHLDTPTILRALPLAWRQRTAVAAAADYFYKKRLVATTVALIFNTVPILRRTGGSDGDSGGAPGMAGGSFAHVDQLIDQRWNLLIFPEGTRSREGGLGLLRPGAAVMARRHNIPIVPIHLRGTHDAMPPGRSWPQRTHGLLSRRHRVEVEFGPPIWPGDGEDCTEVMGRVRRYLEEADRAAAEGAIRMPSAP